MNQVQSIFLAVAALGFLTSSGLYAMYFRGQKNDFGFWATVFASGSLVVLTLSLVAGAIELGQLPIGAVSWTVVFFLWVAVCVYLYVENRWRIKVVGSFFLPAVTAGLFLALWLPSRREPLAPILQSPWVTVHVSSMFLGYGTFLLASLSGILYLVQENEIKSRRLTFMHFRLPSLETLDTLSARLVSWGVLLLGAGLVTGSIWASKVWGSPWSWDPKQTWSLFTWGFYVLFLMMRYGRGWKGRKSAYLTVLGFAAVVFNVLGVTLFMTALHRFS